MTTALVALVLSAPAQAGDTLPSGGHIVAGTGSISTSGNGLIINQSSATGVINWNNFSIGQGGSVTFNNGSGATLNRVTGNSLSQIDGMLNATGSVYLINPNGVVIGPNGRVVTGGSFVASTRSLANPASLGGNMTFAGTGNGRVVNQGTIASANGDVVLVGKTVSNSGSISAPRGTAAMAAGDQVVLQKAGSDQRISILAGTSGNVTNTGAVAAAAAELKAAGGNVYALAGNNGGIIRATGTKDIGGHIWLTSNGGDVTASGPLSASNADGSGGAVTARGANITVSGTIDASATQAGKRGGDVSVIAAANTSFSGTITAKGGKGATGGQVETSGAHLDIASSAMVNTLAEGGRAGNWLIDPYNITISSGASTGSGYTATADDTVINNIALSNALAFSSVTVSTGTGGTQAGDITVSAPISWNRATTLTLDAAGGININSAITAANGGLTLTAGSAITATSAISVASYIQISGDFSQIAASLPTFSTTDFQLQGGSFLRATGGTGTSADPYVIADLYGLQGLGSGSYNTAHYALGADIDVSAARLWNSGDGFAPLSLFLGSLDGQGHVIDNLTIDRATTDYVGLFSRLGNGAQIANLGITNASITGGSYVGTLAGANAGGTINTVTVSGSVAGSGTLVGGLAGQNAAGTIGSSHAAVGVTGGTQYSGGLVGFNSDTITASYATGTVAGLAYVGGLTGSNTGTVGTSYATGSVTAAGDYAGGLSGANPGTISDSYATGNASGVNYVGGLAGSSVGAIDNAYATGNATATGNYAGGLAGSNAGTIQYAYAIGNVSGSDYVGGLAGYSAYSITQSYASGKVSGSADTGGLVGKNVATLSNAYFDTETTGQTSGVGTDVGSTSALTGLTTAEARTQSSYSVFDFTGSGAWYMIDGETRPFLRSEYSTTISNAHQLQLMTMDLTAAYTLAADVDAFATAGSNAAGMWSASGFVPVGDSTTPFTSTFDGQSHTITGLTINRPTISNVGLFGAVNGSSTTAWVQNLGLVDVSITGKDIVGGVAGGVTTATLVNDYVTGTVSGDATATYGYVGGLAGVLNAASITASHSEATVSGGNYVGGLAGMVLSGTVQTSYASGNVSGTTLVGGLIGQNRGTLQKSYAIGNVAGTNYIGGLVGQNSPTGVVQYTYASGAVGGTTNVGGLVGANNSGSVTASYFDTGTTGQLVGVGSYNNSAAYNAVTALTTGQARTQSSYSNFNFTSAGAWYMVDGQTRPFLRSEYSTTITNAHQLQLMAMAPSASYTLANNFDASATSGSNASDMWTTAGFVPIGTDGTGTITNGGSGFNGDLDGQYHVIANLTINRSSASYTGLIGYTSSGAISRVGLANANVTGKNQTGALVGWVYRGAVSDSFATGSVSGAYQVGGLIGQTDSDATLSDISSSVVASGSGTQVGGLVGQNAGTLTRGLATGRVSGGALGGAVGFNSGTVTDVYFDSATAGLTSGAGTAQTTAQLQAALPSGLTFAWANIAGKSYPYLKGFYASGTPQVVSGTAYSDGGSTALSGATVTAVSDGAATGSVLTGASGYYYFLLPSGSLSSTGVLAYLNGQSIKAAGFADNVATTGASALNLYGTSLDLITSEISLSATLAKLTSTIGSYSTSDLGFFTAGTPSPLTASGYGLYVNAAAGYTLDQSLSSGGLLSLTAAGNLTLANAVNWGSTDALSLTTTGGGNIAVATAINAPNATLNLSAAGTVTADAVTIGTFKLASGSWSQIATALPSFSATDFELDTTNVSFIRALGGDGSSATPYQIADVYGLQGMASSNLLSKSFVLANDIDASGTSVWNSSAGFIPIGSSTSVSFTGSFDGQGHTISGLTIKRASTDDIGLFGVIGAATIKNTGLIGGSVTGKNYVGGLVGLNFGYGTISNVYNTGTVTAVTIGGGLAGFNYGPSASISGSYATGAVTVTGSSSAGGLAGGNSGTITNSYATGNVTATSANYVGGLVGGNTGVISASYATGSVKGGTGVGGLVGLNGGGSSISGAFASGTVNGTSTVGGLVGNNSDGSIANAYATGSVTATGSSAGGLIGTSALSSQTISNTYATGAVNGGSNVGGLISGSTVSGTGAITGSFWGTSSTGQSSAVSTGASTGMTGLDAAGMKNLANFTAAGWSIDDTGGTSSVWRIYDGSTAPLLRFLLKPVTVTAGNASKTYDGSAYSGFTYTSSVVGATLLGTLGSDLISKNAGTYSIAKGLYSNQFGYDIAMVAGTLTIDPATLTVTANALSRVYGDANPALTYSYSGFVGGDTASQFTGGLTTSATTTSNTGSYAITQGTLSVGSNYSIAYTGANLTVSARPITVTASAQTMTYGGSLPTLSYSVGGSGLVNGDTLSGGLTTSASSSSNAGGYAISQGSLAASSNYNLTYVGSTLTINPATLTVTSDAKSRIYGDANPALTYAYSGFVNGDTSTLFTGALSTAATIASSVNSYAITLGTLNAGGNYTIAYTGANLTVSARPITVTADNLFKTYGAANPAFTYTVGGYGLVNGDTLSGSLTSTATTASNAGGYSIGLGTVAASSNYVLTFNPGTLTIDPATLTVTADAKSRIYGNANPTLTYSYSGFVNGDTNALFTGALSTAATTASSVNSYAITQGTLSAGSNYSIAYTGANLSVTARPVTVTAAAQSMTYGGSRPILSYSVGGSGLANGDTLSGSLTTAASSGSNAGSYAITQGTLAASSNYNLTYVGNTLTINPATLTVTADAKSRVYGNANPALTYAYSGFVNGDTNTLFTGSLTTSASTTSNVGSYAITQGTLAAGGNYTIAYTGANLTVSARPITVTASAQTMTYGGSLPTLSYSVGGAGLVNGDTLTGSLTTAAATGSNVGHYTIAQGTLAASSNYDLTYNAGTLTITPATLTVTADALSRIYGNANPTLTYSYSGFVNGDTSGLFTGSLATSAATTSNVGSYAVSQGTLAAGGNYSIAYTGANLTVTARPITVTADAQSMTYGGSLPTLTYAIGGGGLVNGDTLSGVLATAGSGSSNVGSYVISQGTLAASSNYSLTYVGGGLVINPATLTVTADALSRVYGNANPSLTYSYSGFVNGDSSALFTGGLTTAAAAASNVGSYAITQGTLSAGGNYTIAYTGANLSVTPRPITVTADTQSMTYGGTVPSLTYTVGGDGLVNGDTLSGSLATAATSASNVGSYTITQGTLAASNNYSLTYIPGVLTINPASLTLTITPDAASKTYGQAITLTGYSATGLENSDSLASVTLTSAGSAATATAGSYDITPSHAVFATGSASNYTINYVTLSGGLTVLPATLTITADALSRAYGDANPTLTYSYSGFVNGDTSSLFTGSLATTATTASGVGSYAVTQGTLSAGGNYSIAYTGANLSVTARPITVTADAQSMTYGGTLPTLTYVIGGDGLVNGDTLSGSLTTAATAASNVGSYAITQGTLATSPNYTLTYAGNTLTISPATLTVTADALSRIYGDTNPSLTYTYSGFVNGDTSSLFTGSLATAATTASDVGSYAITQGTLSAGGNYTIAYTGAGLSITARSLTVTANALSRVYGNANPALTYSSSGFVNGDTASLFTGGLTTAATTASSVGNYAIGQGTLSAGGNYTIAFTGANLSVTARPITVSANNLSRTYGDTNSGLTYTLGGDGLVNGDTLTGSLTTAAVTGSNVGRYTIAQGTLAASSNYDLTYNAGTLTITPATLTVTADTLSRIYGNANPALTYSYSGLVNGDTASLFTGSLATSAATTSNVGSYTVSQGTLSAGGNYTIAFTGANLTVTARPITVTADNSSKIYGAANPLLIYTIGGDGLVNGDALSGSLATAATSASNVGNYAITQGTLAVSSNYDLTYNPGTLTITPATLTVTADALSRIYGNANPALTYSYSGFVNGDTSGLFTGSLATSAAITSNVGSYTITQGTLSVGGNYSIAYTGANLSVTVRPITVTADAQSMAYGGTVPSLTYTVGGDGLVNGDTLSGGLVTAASSTSNVGNYAITQGTLAASPNYSLTYVGNVLTINPAILTVTADALSRVYGDANPTMTYSYSGFVNGDTSGLFTGSLATSAATTSNVGSYTVTQGTLSAGGNYSLTFVPGSLTITPRTLTVSLAAADKTYDTTAADTGTVTLGNVVNGDILSASAVFAFADANAGANKAVTVSDIVLSGNEAGNYVLASSSGAAIATIFKAPLTITAEDISAASVADAVPQLNYTGLLGADTASVVSGLTVTLQPTADPKHYQIVLSGGTAQNYALSTVDGMLTLTVPPLSEQLNALDTVIAMPSQPGQPSWSTYSFIPASNGKGFRLLPIILELPQPQDQRDDVTMPGTLPPRFSIDWTQLSELTVLSFGDRSQG